MYLYTFRNLERVVVVGAATAAVFTEKLRTVVCSKFIYLIGTLLFTWVHTDKIKIARMNYM